MITTVDNIRLTGVVVDMAGASPIWRVSGYFLAGKDKIFTNFVYSTIPSEGFFPFRPSETMEDLSKLLLQEAHRVIDYHARQQFAVNESKEITTIKEVSGGNGVTSKDKPAAVAKD